MTKKQYEKAMSNAPVDIGKGWDKFNKFLDRTPEATYIYQTFYDALQLAQAIADGEIKATTALQSEARRVVVAAYRAGSV